jgi:hypothetical protein
MKAVLNLWSHLEKIKNRTIVVDDEKMDIINNFFINLEKHYLKKTEYDQICFMGSDFFYLPQSKLKTFHYLSGLFKSFNVVLEITVSTILGILYFF